MDNIIYRYTRAQAIADGVLIDVSETAGEAGISVPTALTSAVWHLYVDVPPEVDCQDEVGRLWDILWMLRCHVTANRAARQEVLFRLYVRNDNRRPKLVTLKAICGPGDDAEPVITIMLPEED